VNIQAIGQFYRYKTLGFVEAHIFGLCSRCNFKLHIANDAKI